LGIPDKFRQICRLSATFEEPSQELLIKQLHGCTNIGAEGKLFIFVFLHVHELSQALTKQPWVATVVEKLFVV
jgi:hypothetical protein